MILPLSPSGARGLEDPTAASMSSLLYFLTFDPMSASHHQLVSAFCVGVSLAGPGQGKEGMGALGQVRACESFVSTQSRADAGTVL